MEVNHHEAMAYCRWKGEGMRLMSEAEWTLATQTSAQAQSGGVFKDGQDGAYNLNLQCGSPKPVNHLDTAPSATDLHDIRGNVWEWLGETFEALPGFQPHPLYEDHAAPFFDQQHKMLMGGSWATHGTMAFPSYRNWFRPHFYQHAGFRLAQNL